MPKLSQKPFKEKVWYYISQKLIDFAERIPNTKKGVLHWLQNVRRERDITKNELPSYISTELSKIWICIIIPIEEFELSINSIVQMLDEYKTKRFLGGMWINKKEKYKKLNDIKNGIYGKSWQNFGLLDFNKSKISHYIDYSEFELQSFSGNYIALTFKIQPSKIFSSKLNNIVRKGFQPHVELSVPKSIKTFFRGYWGSQIRMGESYKLEIVQKEIVQLKAVFIKEINRFLTGYFSGKKEQIPSVELWTYKQTQSSYPRDKYGNLDGFWSSLGMRHSSFDMYCVGNGIYKIFWPNKKLNDNPIKNLAYTSNRTVSSGYGSIDEQISSENNYWVVQLLSIWSFRSILIDLNRELTSIRLVLFQYFSRIWKPDLFNLSERIFRIKMTLRRITSIYKKRDLIQSLCMNDFPEFIKKQGKSQYKFVDLLFGNFDFLLKESSSFLKFNQEILDTNINVNVILSNKKTQKIILFLTIVIFLLTFIMTAIMVIENKSELKSVFSEISVFVEEKLKKD